MYPEKSRVIRFSTLSRLLWLGLGVVVIAGALVSVIAHRGTQHATSARLGSDGAMGDMATIVYGGLEWGVESFRKSPPDIHDVVTIILEVRVRNRLAKAPQRVPKRMVKLVNVDGELVPLDRFANNESDDYLFLEPGRSVEVTLPFKVPNQVIAYENWSLSIQESPRVVPAELPLVGSDSSGLSEKVFAQSQSVTYNGTTIEPLRVNTSYNFLSSRAVVGTHFFVIDVIIGNHEVAGDLANRERWKLLLDDQSLGPISVREIQRRDAAVLTLTFRAPEEASDHELLLISDGGPVAFDIVTSDIG